MATISISLDTTQKQLVDRLSREKGVSRSELIQDLLDQASFERSWDSFAGELRVRFDRLGLESIDQLEAFLG